MKTTKIKIKNYEIGRRIILSNNLESPNPSIPLLEMTNKIMQSMLLFLQMEELATSKVKLCVSDCKIYYSY
jgi:hypothetical protein